MSTDESGGLTRRTGEVACKKRQADAKLVLWREVYLVLWRASCSNYTDDHSVNAGKGASLSKVLVPAGRRLQT